MHLDDYWTDRSSAGPSGENLEYDPGYVALFLAAQPKEERQIGKEIIPGEDPNFKEVTEKALAVFDREAANARKPLAAADVIIEEDESNPGYYSSKLFLRPHHQLEGLSVSLRLVSKLPAEKK